MTPIQCLKFYLLFLFLTFPFLHVLTDGPHKMLPEYSSGSNRYKSLLPAPHFLRIADANWGFLKYFLNINGGLLGKDMMNTHKCLVQKIFLWQNLQIVGIGAINQRLPGFSPGFDYLLERYTKF